MFLFGISAAVVVPAGGEPFAQRSYISDIGYINLDIGFLTEYVN